MEQLAEFMERAQPNCLDKPISVKTFAVGPRCGNALLDDGEECDCGTVEVKPLVEASVAGCSRLLIFNGLGKFKYIPWGFSVAADWCGFLCVS